jgi:diguanylate cyclase (GGDEF)-like protein
MTTPLHVLWVGTAPPDLSASDYGPFLVEACASLDAAAQHLRDAAFDALVLDFEQPGMGPGVAEWPSLSHAVMDTALLVLLPDLSASLLLQLAQRGVQDLLPAAERDGAARALRLAVERKRLERLARKAYATDLSTGLPNHAQLLEHMTHLLALREREPAPMALLVLRIEGLAATERALGREAAHVLRRKLAVRVRAGLRASDVVASLGNDAFAVLLAWIDAPRDAMRVAAKLALSLQQPFNVAGHEQAVAVAFGVSQYPEHGRVADELLRRAIGQATATVSIGRGAYGRRVERSEALAANDEGPQTL